MSNSCYNSKKIEWRPPPASVASLHQAPSLAPDPPWVRRGKLGTEAVQLSSRHKRLERLAHLLSRNVTQRRYPSSLAELRPDRYQNSRCSSSFEASSCTTPCFREASAPLPLLPQLQTWLCNV